MNFKKIKGFLLDYPSDIIQYGEEKQKTLLGKLALYREATIMSLFLTVAFYYLIKGAFGGDISTFEVIGLALWSLFVMYGIIHKSTEFVYTRLTMKDKRINAETRNKMFHMVITYYLVLFSIGVLLPKTLGVLMMAEKSSIPYLLTCLLFIMQSAYVLLLISSIEKIRYELLNKEMLPLIENIEGFDQIEPINSVIERRNTFMPSEDFEKMKDKIVQTNHYINTYKKADPYIQIYMYDDTHKMLDKLYADLFDIEFYEDELDQMKRKVERINDI